MASSKALEVSILNQAGVVFKGQCQALFVPAEKDEVAILPLHTPLIMLLSSGEVSIVSDGAKRLISKISHGIVFVGDNEASVLVAS